MPRPVLYFYIVLMIVVVLLPFSCEKARAATELMQAWFYVSDNPVIVLAWDAVPDATRYEVRMTALYPSQEWLQTVTALTATFQRPRGGVFKFAVRACDASTCSEWSLSDGPNATVKKVDGTTVSQAWIMFWRLSAPIPH